MPITPLHIGPGLAIKAVGGKHVSLGMFAFSQVAIDIQPALGLLGYTGSLHGWTHTWPGATLIGLACWLLLTRPYLWLYDKFTRALPAGLRRFEEPPPTWRSAAAGGFLGVWSHMLLDSVMHADMQPWWPFGSANALRGLITIEQLHGLCVLCGIVGFAVWIGLKRYSCRDCTD